MIKEIGSIFPIYINDCFSENHSANNLLNGKYLYSLCREAFLHIAKVNCGTNKKILLPAYTCKTVIIPFEQEGWECHYYNISQELKIDCKYLTNLVEDIKPALVLTHPYYGMDFSKEETECLLQIKNKGCKIIVDLTQNIFSSERLTFVDYYTGSLRKWLNIPDGGFLETKELFDLTSLEQNIEFVNKQAEAMHLRAQYFLTDDKNLKQQSIKLNKEAESISRIEPHKISNLSRIILNTTDNQRIINCRRENFMTLFSLVKDSDQVKRVITNFDSINNAPLYFPIYVKERKKVQCWLSKHNIYCPVLWPCYKDEVRVNKNIQYMYEHILAIPCDQRYTKMDMTNIATLINEYIEGKNKLFIINIRDEILNKNSFDKEEYGIESDVEFITSIEHLKKKIVEDKHHSRFFISEYNSNQRRVIEEIVKDKQVNQSLIHNTSKQYYRSIVTNSILKQNSVVGDFARIEKSIIGYGCKIERYNLFRNSFIDNYSYINEFGMVFNAKIGKFCSIAWGTTIGAAEHPYTGITTSLLDYQPFNKRYNLVDLDNERTFEDREDAYTIIGNDVWLGCNVVIKRGVNIGNGAIIGSGSVVTKDIPPYGIAVGNPARIIKYRFEQNIIDKLLNMEWWNWDKDKIKRTIDLFKLEVISIENLNKIT